MGRIGKYQLTLAVIISNLTNPAVVLMAAVVVVISRFTDSPSELWGWSAASAALLVLPGFLYSLARWRKEGVIDLDLSRREDRVVPLMLASLGALVGGTIVSRLGIDERLVTISYVLVAMLVVLTIITSVWKISLHTATMSALVSLLVFYRGESYSYLYLLLLPTAWVRLTLKQHTKAQLAIGAILGVIVTLVLSAIFQAKL